MNTEVYDKNLNFLAELENAHAINIKRPLNGLWKAGFTLPADDPDNEYCQGFYFVKLYDNDEEVGMFRIVANRLHRNGNSGSLHEYKLEHCLSTLLDPGITGREKAINIPTGEVIEFLLSFQTKQHWVLGQCDFAYMYEYLFENVDSVYNAIMSIFDQFPEPYVISWDDSVYPFQLKILKANTKPVARIRYGYNMRDIERSIDERTIVTKVKPLGYGEGDNQLTIESVNNGSPFLYAEQSLLDKYGEVFTHLPDRRFKNPEALKNYGQRYLDKYKVPEVTYKVQAANVYPKTKLPIDKFEPGMIVEIHDDDLGIKFNGRIEKVDRPDTKGQPGDVTLEIEHKVESIVDAQNETRDRQRIQDLVSKGNTSMDSQQFGDNCDPNNPAVIRFWIDQNAEAINEVLLSYETREFEGYIQGTKGGGSQTTSAGGGQTTSAGGNHSHKMFHLYDSTARSQSEFFGYYAKDGVGQQIGGYLGIDPFGADGLYTFSSSGEHAHSVSDHTHSVSDHTHPIIYGVFKRSQKPTSIALTVDGNAVPNAGLNENNLDLVPYLSKDSSGMIERGKWHEIQVTPDDLGRITGNILVKQFIQSLGKYSV